MAVGWLVMAAMAYLIVITKAATPKIWDPYDILQISKVGSGASSAHADRANIT